MSLLWPWFLLLLGLIPLSTAAYLRILRRKRRFAVRYSSLSLVRDAIPQHSWLRRHLPFALLLLGTGALVIAGARPTATVQVPTGEATIMLAIDISGSMGATDIPPTRLAAAKRAALSFVQRREGSRIGVVAFAGFAALVQPPTTDQEALIGTIESLSTARGTAVGSGILESLDVIAELYPDVAPVEWGAVSGAEPAPRPEGEYAPAVIVVLTDGVSRNGPHPLDAAEQAVDRGVRVYTIGFGTEEGGYRGGGYWGGGRFSRGIDEETLMQIAEMTGGQYYAAASASELQAVFENLPNYLTTRPESVEISVLFAALGALVVTVALALGLLWQPLP